MPLQKEIRELLDRPNFFHFTTLMPDGSPTSTPVWGGVEADHVIICTGENTLKAKNVRRDPRVSISVVDFDDPYEEVQIRGRVAEIRDDTNFRNIDATSRKYTGKPFPWRDPKGRIALVIEVESARYTKLPFKHTPPQLEPV